MRRHKQKIIRVQNQRALPRHRKEWPIARRWRKVKSFGRFVLLHFRSQALVPELSWLFRCVVYGLDTQRLKAYRRPPLLCRRNLPVPNRFRYKSSLRPRLHPSSNRSYPPPLSLLRQHNQLLYIITAPPNSPLTPPFPCLILLIRLNLLSLGHSLLTLYLVSPAIKSSKRFVTISKLRDSANVSRLLNDLLPSHATLSTPTPSQALLILPRVLLF